MQRHFIMCINIKFSAETSHAAKKKEEKWVRLSGNVEWCLTNLNTTYHSPP